MRQLLQKAMHLLKNQGGKISFFQGGKTSFSTFRAYSFTRVPYRTRKKWVLKTKMYVRSNHN